MFFILGVNVFYIYDYNYITLSNSVVTADNFRNNSHIPDIYVFKFDACYDKCNRVSCNNIVDGLIFWKNYGMERERNNELNPTSQQTGWVDFAALCVYGYLPRLTTKTSRHSVFHLCTERVKIKLQHTSRFSSSTISALTKNFIISSPWFSV